MHRPMPHAVTAADHALREACAPLIRAVSDDGDVARDAITADDLVRLQRAGEDARANTPLRRAVEPFLESLKTRDGRVHFEIDAITPAEWMTLKRADARADALLPTDPTKQAAADERLFAIGQRFSGAVYNDNGDVSLSTSWVQQQHWIELRDAIPAARPDHPLRRIGRTFVRCLVERDGRTVIDEDQVTTSHWVTIRNTVIYR